MVPSPYGLLQGIVFLVSVGYCLKVLNKLPSDILAIVHAIRERNKREIWGSVGEAVFVWALVAFLICLLSFPSGV